MNIPKGINKLLSSREKYAILINQLDERLDYWLKKNNIIIGEEDVCGEQVLLAPEASVARIRAAILVKPAKKKIEKNDELMYLRRFIGFMFCNLNAAITSDDLCIGIPLARLADFLAEFDEFYYKTRKLRSEQDKSFAVPMKIHPSSGWVVIQCGQMDFDSIGISKDDFQKIVTEYENAYQHIQD